MAVGAGPLCEEPMWGTAIIVDEWTVKEVDDPTMAGALISGMKQACRSVFLVTINIEKIMENWNICQFSRW